MRHVLKRLREEEIEPNKTDEYPGLASLCQCLTRFVNHRDKDIRLYTVAACMELFTVYAPECPWNELETLEIFKQTIRQLANLGHTVSATPNASGSNQANRVSTNNIHYYQYYRILELLAEVKMAVLLVDLSKKNDEDHVEEDEDENVLESQETAEDSDDSSSDSEDLSQNQKRRRSPRKNKGSQPKTKKLKPKVNIKKEALQILSELFRTLLQSVRNEHKTEILEFCQKTLTSCVEEFFETVMIPVPILDELLVCIGQGPRVLVLQQQTQRKAPDAEAKQKRGRKRTVGGKTQPILVTVQQNNPSYMVASAVVRASVERLSTPIATLVNGLVNSDPRYIGQSMISNHVCENSDSDEGNQKKSAIPAEVLEMVSKLGKPQKQQQDIHGQTQLYCTVELD